MGIDVDPEDLVGDGDDHAPPSVVFVTAATSSPFNLVIPLIGALVCDGGSLLSHPAITAREHGTPCVVNAQGCCSLISTGDIVRVDADNDTVTIVRRTEASA
jgi:phosphohistidine swiveling domain-containing protein